MNKLNRVLLFIIITGLVLMTVSIISAQQQGGGDRQPPQGQNRQQFDPQQMMARRMQQIMERLKLSEEETAVLKPKIESLLNIRPEQMRAMRDLTDSLQKAIDSKDESKIKTALTAVKKKREENKLAFEKAEKELIELLSVEQEANLTLMGIVNSDGFGGMFPGGGMQRPGQRPGAGAPPPPNR